MKPLFQNREKLDSFRSELDRSAIRTESADELTRRNLISRLRKEYATRHPRRISRILVPGVAALLILGMGFLGYQKIPWSDAPAQITEKADSSTRPLREMRGLISSIPLHGPVRVPVAAGAKVVLNDQSTLWMPAETTVSFLSDSGDLNLTAGRMLASFNKRNVPTKIHTASCVIEVLGTVFSLRVSDDETELRLFEGRIALLAGGVREIVDAGWYVRVKNNGINARRPLDASDVISALLIPEQTYALSGPKLPELSLPATDTADENPAVEKPATAPAENAQKKPRQLRPRKHGGGIADAPPKVIQAPPEDDMTVESMDAPTATHDTQKPTIPAAEQLLEDACTNLKNGNHAAGKAKIRDYLQQHPRDRYWKHVHSIFE